MKPLKKFFSLDDIDFTSIDTWIHGLVAAVISAGSTAGSGELVAMWSKQNLDWPSFGTALGVSSLIAAFVYLKSSPVPKQIFKSTDITETPTTTTTQTVEVTQKK